MRFLCQEQVLPHNQEETAGRPATGERRPREEP